MNSAARLVGVHPDTVARHASLAGLGCELLHDRVVRGVHASTLQLDEMWGFVGKKQKRVVEGDPPEYGDAWTFLALDVSSRLIVSYYVGKRTAESTCLFLSDLRPRVVGKPTLISDGFQSYGDAVERAYGADARFGMMVKQYEPRGGRPDGGRYTGAVRTAVFGAVDPKAIQTSYVERVNLTVRMSNRRFTRKTNGYSKRVERLRESVALYVAFYNFVRVHETLRVTPAMEAGLTTRIWTLEELLDQAEALRTSPPDNDNGLLVLARGAPGADVRAGRPVLRLLPGGAA